LEVDGSTVIDPETGRAVPVAVLRLAEWLVREVAAALEVWSRVQELVSTAGAQLPREVGLSRQLAAVGRRSAAGLRRGEPPDSG
jgi:hypothetical protein